MNYPLTIEMIQDYLNTLQPDDEAGITWHAFQCPVARAAEFRYGLAFVVTEDRYYPKNKYEFRTTTPPEIADLIRAIDATKEYDSPITRKEVEWLLPQDQNQDKEPKPLRSEGMKS